MSVAEDNDPPLNIGDVYGMSQGTQSREQPKDAAHSARSPSVTLQEHEIEKVFAVREYGPRNTQFLVQWVGFENPTWQPAGFVPPSAIEEFYRERFTASQPQSGTRRSSRRGRGVRRGRGGSGNTADGN